MRRSLYFAGSRLFERLPAFNFLADEFLTGEPAKRRRREKRQKDRPFIDLNGFIRAQSAGLCYTLENINADYMQTEATESFKNLYAALKESVSSVVARNCYNLGYEAFRTENYDVAIDNLARAYEYNPSNGEALYNLGNSYNKKGETDKAVEIYEQVVELFPHTEKARKSQNYIREIKGE